MTDQTDVLAGGEFAPGHRVHTYSQPWWRGGVRWWGSCLCGMRIGPYKSETLAAADCYRHAGTVLKRLEKGRGNG